MHRPHMVAIVGADEADAVMKFIRASTLRSSATEDGQKHKTRLIGDVVRGTGERRASKDVLQWRFQRSAQMGFFQRPPKAF